MSPRFAVKVIEQLAGALDAAHAAGLVHRDVKPSNALVTGRDFVYLIDFGIAHDASATKLTRTGTTVGTWAYMAPERFTTGTADARADVYALACVLYESLTRQLPYPGDSMPQQYHGHLTVDPPKPTAVNPAIPAGFDEVVARGMAKDPDRRYQTATELAVAAEQALTEPVAVSAVDTSPAVVKPTTLDDRSEPRNIGQQAGGISQQPRQLASTGPTPPQPPSQAPWWPPVGGTGRPPPPPSWAPPQQPPRPTPARRSRRPWIIAGVAAVVVLVAAVVGIRAIVGHHTSQTVPTSETGPTSQTVPTSHMPYPSQVTLPFTGLNSPNGVAVDSAGNVYVADQKNSRALKLAAGSTTQTELPFTGLLIADGVAVDSAGTVYVTDWGNNRVLKLAVGSTTQTELPFTGLNHPGGVAVDNAGNVYVTDWGNNRVLKLAVGSSASTELPFTGLNHTVGVAVDSAGNVYVPRRVQ
jgi:serine/threonine protein kinase, bacterial